MHWSFATINSRLAEIFYEKKDKKSAMKIFGHTYIDRKEYKMKWEKVMIEKDTSKLNFIYRKGVYKSKT